MSSLTTTTINTKDGATNLFLKTGNTLGAVITLGVNNSVKIGNATSDFIVGNSTAVGINAAATFTNTISVTGAATFSNTTSFVGTATIPTVAATTVNANVFSGNTVSAVNAAISSNTLTLGTSSIASTGYTRLPNGLLYQWGSVSVTSTTGDVTFNPPFTSLYSFTATPTNISTVSATYAVFTNVANTTVAQLRTANSTTKTVYWMAIGV